MWSPDIIQKLTYKLTHLYYNWPGVVSYPNCLLLKKKMLIFGGDVSHRLFFFAAVCLQLLCLLFQVKVPMVCQYAHKLAFLIGESVHARPHDAQQELLYYL